MDRRSFLKTTGAAAGAAALPISVSAGEAMASPAILQGMHRLQLGTRFPVDQPGTSTFLIRLAECVSAMSDGRIELLTPKQSDGPAAADLVLGFPAGTGEMALAYDLVAGVPGGLDEQQTVSWLSFGGGLRLWSDIAHEAGQKIFYAGHTGDLPLLWAKRSELRTLDGASVAVDGFGARVAEALGARVTSAATAADLVEGFSPLADLMSGLPRRFTSCNGSPFHNKGRTLALTMPLERWEALAHADKAILEVAVASHAPLVGSELRSHRLMACQAMQQRHQPKDLVIDGDVNRSIAAIDLLDAGARMNRPTARIIASFHGAMRMFSAPMLHSA